MKKILSIIVTLFIIVNTTLWANYVININRDNKEYSDLLLEWYDYYQNKDYETTVDYYEKAYNICWNQQDCELVENLLVSVYYVLASNAYEIDDTETSIRRYKKLLGISPFEFSALVNIWIAYIWEDPQMALSYLKRAKKYAENQRDLELVENNIKSVEWILENFDDLKEEKKLKDLNKTNDTFVYKQYYLYYLNIFKAWKEIPNNGNTIIVAVIDDWIKYDHPDLKNNVWTNNWEILWNWIDDDGNWYIDDYVWWNFVKKSNDITPVWSHWTMIAWIIWATSNNKEWIAWIIPNWKVKLMSLIVFWDDWKATDKNIISAINYAIDNWANIINLSLWWELHEYSDKYDEVIKRANNKWIVVVAAAGNWDETKKPKVWINTSNDLLSPVCNGEYKYSIIWVWSLDKSWNVSSWSNYWNCVDVYSYWESIFSTSNSWDNLYLIWSWTSFSAPIVVGIIWLWQLKYWNIWVSDIYSTIKKSLSWNTIDVEKYLENLWKVALEALPQNVQTNNSKSLGWDDILYRNSEKDKIENAKQYLWDKAIMAEAIAEALKKKDSSTQKKVKEVVESFKDSDDEYTKNVGIYLWYLIQ